MKLRTAAAILAAAAMVTAGCSTDPEVSDEDHIRDLVSKSGYVGMDPLTAQGEGSTKATAAPEGWYREKTGEGDWEVTFWNDPATGVCTLTVQRTLQGELNIDVVHDGQWNPGTKPIADVRTRHLVVERTGESSAPRGGWTLQAISAGEHALSAGASADQEVQVAAMSVYVDGAKVWETADTETFFDVDTELPDVDEGDLVRVEAELTHLNPQLEPPYFVYVHGPCPTWQRHPLNDDGLYGDRTAGDGVYSYEWYAENVERRHFLAVDVLDADTMEDQTEDDYDSAAWGIHFARKEG